MSPKYPIFVFKINIINMVRVKFKIVLSLCDGISCAYLALKRAGFKFDKYYGSDICDSSKKISKHNNKDIIQLGDMTKWREWDIDWKSVGIIFAGTPCQALSAAGKRKGFDDPRSNLFFVFAEILDHVKSLNPDVKFLFENVKMKPEYRDIISKRLGVLPVEINSDTVGIQNRVRYYWFNFKYIPITNLNIKVGDVIPNAISGYSKNGVKNKRTGKYEYPGRVNKKEKVYTITRTKGNTANLMLKDGNIVKLTVEQAEIAQTLPIGYTDVPDVTQTNRWESIGNGWTVDVIAHILKGLL
jgi:site-specific DNA-cytosine methylase